MNALVLCGGRGTRLDADVEKPLYEVDGRPMIDRVLEALAGARVEQTFAAVSPHAPATREHLANWCDGADGGGESADWSDDARSDGRQDADWSDGADGGRQNADVASDVDRGDVDRPPAADVEIVDTPGEGYVADLETALETVGRPAVTVAADLPLLAAEHVDDAVTASGDGARSLTVRVPASLKRLLGVTCDRSLYGVAPTGLNVVGPEDVAGGTRRSYDVRLAVNVNTVGDARVAEALL